MNNVKFISYQIKNPDNLNLIFGQSHFIKTVTDIHETLVTSVSNIKFGLAFSEASGDRLVRTSGTDKKLEKLAAKNVLNISCGHCFLIFLKDSFPINVLNNLKQVSEVCTIYAATANPVQLILAQTNQGRGVASVIDGNSPKAIESESHKKQTKTFLRKIGYKL